MTPARLRRLVARASVGLAIGLVANASQSACSLRTMALPVKIVDHRAVATVGINGTAVPLLVDTGAFYSSLTPEAAERLQLQTGYAPQELGVRGVTGHVDVRIAVVKRLRIQDGEIPNIQFLVGGHLFPGVMGILGRNILSFEDTEYDLAHGVIRFVGHDGDCSNTNLAYWARDGNASEVRLARSDADVAPAIVAPARVNGQQIQVLLDSGATSLISLDAAKRLGLRWDADDPKGRIQGLGEKETPFWASAIDAFELGDEEIRKTSLRVAEIDTEGIDMLLGIEFFLSHRIIVASTSRRLFFTYNGGKVFGLQNDLEPPGGSSSAR